MSPQLPPPRPPVPSSLRSYLVALALGGAWLYWSLLQTPAIFLLAASASDPHRTGLGLLVGGLAGLGWVAGVIPAVLGFLALCALPTGRIQQALQRPIQAPHPALDVPEGYRLAQPVLIERIVLTQAEAQARGLESPVIVERIHYR